MNPVLPCCSSSSWILRLILLHSARFVPHLLVLYHKDTTCTNRWPHCKNQIRSQRKFCSGTGWDGKASWLPGCEILYKLLGGSKTSAATDLPTSTLTISYCTPATVLWPSAVVLLPQLGVWFVDCLSSWALWQCGQPQTRHHNCKCF